ncbi:hypothetical protein, partial [Akkermansia sp. BIOML-A45]|uniref:hypothetical protein n=1 Tax=Akkermansia sp. BIOML-A45 TaxID=2584601 RepID=UPI0019D54C96
LWLPDRSASSNNTDESRLSFPLQTLFRCMNVYKTAFPDVQDTEKPALLPIVDRPAAWHGRREEQRNAPREKRQFDKGSFPEFVPKSSLQSLFFQVCLQG